MYNNKQPYQRDNRPNRDAGAGQRTRVIPLDFLKVDYNINDKGKEFNEKIFGAGEGAKPNITVTQIRKFLSVVNSIQNKIDADEKNYNYQEIQFIRTKLAYQAGRERKLKDMYDELDPIIKEIKNAVDFKKFARLIESIVAYHKFYGGN